MFVLTHKAGFIFFSASVLVALIPSLLWGIVHAHAALKKRVVLVSMPMRGMLDVLPAATVFHSALLPEAKSSAIRIISSAELVKVFGCELACLGLAYIALKRLYPNGWAISGLPFEEFGTFLQKAVEVQGIHISAESEVPTTQRIKRLWRFEPHHWELTARASDWHGPIVLITGKRDCYFSNELIHRVAGVASSAQAGSQRRCAWTAVRYISVISLIAAGTFWYWSVLLASP